jgi:hypothetical protein
MVAELERFLCKRNPFCRLNANILKPLLYRAHPTIDSAILEVTNF